MAQRGQKGAQPEFSAVGYRVSRSYTGFYVGRLIVPAYCLTLSEENSEVIQAEYAVATVERNPAKVEPRSVKFTETSFGSDIASGLSWQHVSNYAAALQQVSDAEARLKEGIANAQPT